MHKLNRILSLTLVLLMCLGMFPSALAAPDISGNGTINVTTHDAVTNQELPNAEYKLERLTAGIYQDMGNTSAGPNGKVTFKVKEAGWYRVTQVAAPAGYVLHAGPYVRYLDNSTSSQTIDFRNTAERALYIYRIDPSTNQPHSGAHYEVKDNNNITVAEGTTKADGYLVIPSLPAGEYSVTETNAPAGFTDYQKTQNIRITSAGVSPYILVFAGASKNSITVLNLDGATGEPILGASFNITPAGGTVAQHITTNAAGLAVLHNLEPNTYIVAQTKVGNGYVPELKSQNVTVSDGSNVVVTITNLKPASIKVFSANSVDGTALSGMKFSLYNQNAKLVKGPTPADANGLVTFTDITDGNYTVVCEAPAGYVADVHFQSASIKRGHSLDLLFTATPQGGIQLIAEDDTTGARLANAKFRVTKMNGELVGEFSTGSDGTKLLGELVDGYYTIEQIAVPAGYAFVKTSQVAQVLKGVITPVTFTQHSKPFIIVETTIKGTTSPVAEAVFEVHNASGKRVAGGSTDARGKITFDELDPGVYTVNFVSAPNGYTIDTATVTVTVTRAQAGLAKFTCSKHSAIIITKLDGKTSAPLAGAKFQLRNYEGQAMGLFTTDAAGVAVTDILTPGKYYVQELFAPDTYVPNSVSRLVTVKNNETSQEIFTNNKKTAIVVYAYTVDGAPLADVNYTVTNAITGKEVAKIKTDATGMATYTDVTPGMYLVQEVTVPANYVLTSTAQSRVSVSTDVATAVNFAHIARSVILMQTVDTATGAAIPGAVYQITTNTGAFVGNYEADDNGEAQTDVLEAGTYFVKQISAPSGYLLNTTTQTVLVDKDKTNQAKFFNVRMSGLVIEAVAQNGHQPLAGCVFEVYDEAGKQVFHGTTDVSGLLNTGALTPGKYTIKQLATREGYSIVQPNRTVTVTQNDATTVVFENTALTAIYIELIDETSRKPIAGGRFKIEQDCGDYVSEVVTDESGSASVTGLPVGKYMVHESAAPDGYVLVGTYQWADLKSTANTHLKFTNKQVSGLVIQALMLNGHSPLSGATFEVYAQNEKLIGTYTSDATGSITVTGLQPGQYLVKEVKAPADTTIQTATQTVTVTTDAPTTATFYHTMHSSLVITKLDANGKPVPNAVYRVEKANGDYVGDYTTDVSGRIVIASLAAGNYRVYETKVPNGYIADPTPKTVTIKDEQTATLEFRSDIVTGLTILNTAKQSGKPIAGNRFKITKVDGTLIGNYVTNTEGRIDVELQPGNYVVYETYVIGGVTRDDNPYNVVIKANVRTTIEIENEVKSGIRLHFIDKDTKVGVYKVRVEILDNKNNLIGTYNSDDSGYVKLDGVLDAGSYKVRVLSVPTGYDRVDVVRTIDVKIGETTDVEWELSGAKGQIRVIVLSATDSSAMNIRKNSRLTGATFRILDTNGKEVKSITTMNNGEAFSGALPIGTYYVEQTGAATGFIPNPARVTVNVTQQNKDVTITVYNNAGMYDLTISANGQAIGYAGMQTKFYFNNIRSSVNIAMTNFYLHIKVPTDALRTGTLYTGTWNFSTAYEIQYRTNLSDYRTLASNLNSKSQYSYDLSTIALGLGSDEYVTDIRFVFPGVTAGFHESMAPTLYCSVLSTVPTGYQYTLRADVGGQIGGAYYTGANEFAARVINTLPTYPIPSTLPKTGN